MLKAIFGILAEIFGELIFTGIFSLLGSIWNALKERLGWWGATFIMVGGVLLIGVLCVGAVRWSGLAAAPR